MPFHAFEDEALRELISTPVQFNGSATFVVNIQSSVRPLKPRIRRAPPVEAQLKND